MKLEVGMYVRTKLGIDKIKDIVLNGNFYEDSGLYLEKNGKLICGKKGMKELRASHNIIDLIEEGDYVNGYRVINVGVEELGYTYLSLDMNEDIHWLESEIENEEQIKSIVTKEQFESVSYEVSK